MAELEEATAVTPQELSKWYLLKKQLGEVKSAEAMMRTRIAKFFFPTPDEGTNTHPLKDGTGANLKMVHSIDRKVDEGELAALDEALAIAQNDPTNNLHTFSKEIDLTKLIVWKPELKIAEYRKLTEAQRQVFDRILVVKPGMPQLDITIPKRGS